MEDSFSERSESVIINKSRESSENSFGEKEEAQLMHEFKEQVTTDIAKWIKTHEEQQCCNGVMSVVKEIQKDLQASQTLNSALPSMTRSLALLDETRSITPHIMQFLNILLKLRKNLERLDEFKRDQLLEQPSNERTEFVCRVCEEMIPMQLLDKHTRYCKKNNFLVGELHQLKQRQKELATALKVDIDMFVNKTRQSPVRPIVTKTPSPTQFETAFSASASVDSSSQQQQQQQQQNNQHQSSMLSPSKPVLSRRSSQVKSIFTQLHYMVTVSMQDANASNEYEALKSELDEYDETLTSMQQSERNSAAPEYIADLARFSLYLKRVAAIIERSQAVSHSIEENKSEYAKAVEQIGMNPGLLYLEKTSVQQQLNAMDSKQAAVTNIRDFELVKPITKGTFGAVFLARRKATGDIFCIKSISKHDSLFRNNLDRVLREKEVMSKLHHPFIVPLYWAFQTKFMVYLVMEYEIGGDLFSLIDKKGRLSEADTRFYISELICALCHIHSLGIVHRDIKPDNILISASGHIKLADFGLVQASFWAKSSTKKTPPLSNREASHFDTETFLNRPLTSPALKSLPTPRTHDRFFSMVGTPSYASPEIILSHGHGYATDFWSTGCVMWECLTGRAPFSGISKEDIFQNIVSKNLPPFEIQISEQASDLVEGLLRLNPERRLGTNGLADFQTHPFFKGLNWSDLTTQVPPFVPKPNSEDDMKYFSDVQQLSMDEMIPSGKDKKTLPGIDEEDCDFVACNERLPQFSYKNVTLLSERNLNNSSGSFTLSFKDKMRSST